MSQAIMNLVGGLGGRGLATGGTKTTLVDTNKVFEADIFNSTIVKIRIGSVDYYRTITDTSGSTITFATLPGTPASSVWTIEVGVTITVTSVADGGNEYTIVAALAGEINQPLAVALVGDVITVTLATGADGLSSDVANTVTLVTAAIDALAEFAAVAAGAGATVVTPSTATFSGGIEEVKPIADTSYEIMKRDTTKLSQNRTAGVLHRSAIAAVDKLANVTITAADQAGVVGVMANAVHRVAVAPGNKWGTVGASAIVTVTPTLDKTVDITVPQSAGAEYYDVFFSTDAAPLWLGRVTEAQRAAGCAITAVGVVGAGGSAGVVNVRLVGTGIATTNAVFAQNNAYTPASVTEIDTTGRQKAYIYVKSAVTDLRSAPTLTIIPFLKNQISGEFHQGTAQAVLLLSALGQSLEQVFEVDVDGATGLVVLVGTISGQGATATIHVELV